VVAPDLHGYGRSDPWPGRAPLRLADEAVIAARLFDVCDGPVHLVGHSYGGAVALRLALDHPGRLRSLTLIEPVAFHLLRNGDFRGIGCFGEIRRVAQAVNLAVSNGDYRSAMTGFVDYWGGPGTWARLSDRHRDAVTRVAPAVALNFWSTMTEPQVLSDYALPRLPTLLLRGDRSPAPTRRIVDLLAAVIPDARVETVAGGGHMSPLTHPDVANTAIIDHLHDHSPARQRAA
jgi:pimeloyl-ACP methyl ester carboxylesterase